MKNIDLLKKKVSGVERSFLIKDGKILERDFEEETLQYLFRILSFLIESFVESNKDLRRISIHAESRCMIFFYDNYILGVVASKSTNFPLLKMVSNKLLLTIEMAPEEKEVIIDKDLRRTLEFIR